MVLPPAPAARFLDELIMFGGQLMRRGDIPNELDRLGGTPKMISLYKFGLDRSLNLRFQRKQDAP